MSHAPLSGDELDALKTSIHKQFRYHDKLVIAILRNQSSVCVSIAINIDIFINLPDLLAGLPKSTVEVSLLGTQIVLVGKVVDILGVTEYLAQNVCRQKSHREGSFLCVTPVTDKQL